MLSCHTRNFPYFKRCKILRYPAYVIVQVHDLYDISGTISHIGSADARHNRGYLRVGSFEILLRMKPESGTEIAESGSEMAKSGSEMAKSRSEMAKSRSEMAELRSKMAKLGS